MVGKLLLGIFVLSCMIATCSAQKCMTEAKKLKKVFAKCRDLPQLNSYLYWTYSQNGYLDMAFRHAEINDNDRWVAWAINPNYNINSSMVGAQALVAISKSGGPPKVYTSSIHTAKTNLCPGKISYKTSSLKATRELSVVTIYATITLPKGTTQILHLWQDGPLSGSTPQAHALATSNANAKEFLTLV